MTNETTEIVCFAIVLVWALAATVAAVCFLDSSRLHQSFAEINRKCIDRWIEHWRTKCSERDELQKIVDSYKIKHERKTKD